MISSEYNTAFLQHGIMSREQTELIVLSELYRITVKDINADTF